MGIGISYTGHDGRKASFTAENGESARRILADTLGQPAMKRHGGNALREAARKMMENGGRGDESAKPKVMPGGGVVDTPSGLCLRGEENSPLVEGAKVFASVNGSKGYKTLNEIDPPVVGPRIGPTFDEDSEDADNSSMDFTHAGSAVIGGRVKMSVDPNNGEITFYQMMREIAWSAGGRITSMSGEMRRVVGTFTPGEGGSSDFGVFPIIDTTGEPLAFYFGKDAELKAIKAAIDAGESEPDDNPDGVRKITTTSVTIVR